MVRLLGRHNKRSMQTGKWVEQENAVEEFNPLSPNFKVPDWLLEKPTPWNLASYWEQCLANATTREGLRESVNGIKAELRPAKKLLSQYGVDRAARMCRYWADQFSCQVTLHYVLKKAEEFEWPQDLI